MQKMLGYMRKAIQEFDLISDGDVIAVGVSGGKDSLVLLNGLVMLRRFIGIDYNIVSITLDPQFDGVPGNYAAIEEMCRNLDVECHIIPTHIGEIVFNVRKKVIHAVYVPECVAAPFMMPQLSTVVIKLLSDIILMTQLKHL